MDNNTGLACQRYNNLSAERDVYLNRAREAARYTIPALIPEATTSSYNTLYKPWQSLGARGVRNLASKLLLALFPSTQSFFRLSPTQKLLAEIPDEEKTKYDQALGKIERVVRKQFDSRAFRAPLFEGLKHLIVGGNAALFVPPEGTMRVFPLSQYVARRDPSQALMELIVKESVDVEALPASVREAVEAKVNDATSEGQPHNVDVYTRIIREGGQYVVSQEAQGISIPEASGTYPLNKCPWIALRWTRIDGESYGRALCEEMIGDLRSYEKLAKARIEAAAISARCVFAVRPGAVTNVKDLTEAANGEFIVGNPEDIVAIQAERFADMQVANAQAQELRSDLSMAFMLNSAVQRDAERVTAEEIRFMANELESSLGGVYSVLSADFQLPLVNVLLVQLQKKGDLPQLPDNSIDLTIVTGFDALGRSSDIQRLNELLGTANQIFGPGVVPEYVSVSDYLTKALTSYGLDGDGLIRSENDVAQMNNVRQTQQLALAAAPNAVKAISDHSMAAQQQPQQQAQSNG